jgi:flagellar biosynthetic protein FliR
VDATVFSLPWNDALSGVGLLLRASAFVAVVPIIGAEGLPVRLKIAIALAIVVLLAPVVPAPDPAVGLVQLVTLETFVGLVLGFAGRMIVEATVYAGGLAGYPAGLAMATMLDPVTNLTVPTLGTLYRLLSLLAFLAIGGHHQFLGVLARSYEIVPAGTVSLAGPWLEGAVALIGRVIVLGFRLAAPVIVAGLLVDLILMLIARAVPQMHILIVGAPIRLVVGLLAIGFSLHVIVPMISEALDGTLGDLSFVLRSFAQPAR